MQLFKRKPKKENVPVEKKIWDYKILEKYEIDIEKINEIFQNADPQLKQLKRIEYCEFLGETNTYRIYIYHYPNGSYCHKYLLRQEKAHLENIVYLGSAEEHICIFHENILEISSFSPDRTTHHPLICLNIETGKKEELNILSSDGILILIGHHGHSYCQDCVKSLLVENDIVKLKVLRYKKGSWISYDPDGTKHSEIEFIYEICISYENNEFQINYNYPKDKVAPWRDETGKISCKGDDCLIECDENCPIFLNTIGLSLLKEEQYENAIEAFKDALHIAPDFLDAQNNLGTTFGMCNQHQKAYDAFLAAHKMKENYPNALFGLIVAETNLGLIDDALQHCNEYDMLPGCDSIKLRQRLNQCNSITQNTSDPNFLDIVPGLIHLGNIEGFLTSQEIPFVPEIVSLSDKVCMKICKAMQDSEKGHADNRAYAFSLKWSAYAGIGAVYLWHTNWEDLKKKSLYEELVRERGIQEMDEYVHDLIGLPYESPEGELFTSHLTDATLLCMDIVNEMYGKLNLEIVKNATKAMFVYGMVYEMNRLGMV